MSTPSSDVSPRPRGASDGGPAVERLTGSIGAVLHGMDLSAPLSERDVDVIRGLVAEHQVVFARDHHLDEEQFRVLANRFGALSIHPSVS